MRAWNPTRKTWSSKSVCKWNKGESRKPLGIQGKSDLSLFSIEPTIILNQNLRAIKKKKKQPDEARARMDSGLGADHDVTEALFAPLSNELTLATKQSQRGWGKIFAGSVTHPGPETPCLILQLRYRRLQGPSSLLETWTSPRCISKIALAKGKNQQCGVPASRKKNVLYPNKTELAAELLIPCLKCILNPTLLFWTLLLYRRILGLLINSHGTVVPPVQPRTWSQFQSAFSLTGVQLLHLQQKKLTDSAVPSGSNTWLPGHHPSDFQVSASIIHAETAVVCSLGATIKTYTTQRFHHLGNPHLGKPICGLR